MLINLSLTVPPPFYFRHVVRSHGWVDLAPNVWDETRSVLRRVERLGSGRVVMLDITGGGAPDAPRVEITVETEKVLTPAEAEEVRRSVGRMLRLDEDLSEFYALCRERGEPWRRAADEGLGRILASPTVFEDVVKVICTTNIQWGGTKRMVREIVTAYGEPFVTPSPQSSPLGGGRAFPTPATIAAVTADKFAATVHLGYRAPFVHALACRVATGELDPEALRDPSIPTAELRKRLLAIKGIGPYAAASLLMLLGRYDELAVDTVFRQFVGQRYFGGALPSDAAACAVYESWGRWKYLAYWFDIWSQP